MAARCLAALAAFISSYGIAAAQADAFVACLEKLASDVRYAPLAARISLGARQDARAQVPADLETPGAREQPLIAQWAAARSECARAEIAGGNPAYRPPLQTYRLEAENAVIEAAADLHDGNLSYAAFNRRRLEIDRDLRERSAGLSRRIQAQRAAQEQSDQLAREHQLLQRSLQDAERQSTLAQQQASLAQRNAEATRRADAASYPAYRTRAAAPAVLPYANCFRLSDRVVCTFR